MQRTAITATCVLALLVTASPTAASSRSQVPGRCPPGHSELIAADAQAQVYEAFDPAEEGFKVYGCAYGHKRSYGLGLPFAASGTAGGGVDEETLAGPVVAYEESAGSETSAVEGGSGFAVVVVRDLRTARVLHRVPTGTPSVPDPSHVGVGAVVALVVKSNGAVAWIVHNLKRSTEKSSYYEVHELDKAGGTVLASGMEIAPHSLALAGSTLYWTQGGKPASAPLN
jgi:hypothetical protein